MPMHGWGEGHMAGHVCCCAVDMPISGPDDEGLITDGVIRWERLVLDRLIDRGTTGRLFRCRLDDSEEPLIVRRHGLQVRRDRT